MSTLFDDNSKFRDVEVEGIKGWWWPTADDGAWDGPLQDWYQLKKALDFVKEKKVVVQAGGNCGLYPRLLSDIFERVYTFEPDVYNFHFLTKNCQKENIIKINAALGDTNRLVGSVRDSGSFSNPNCGSLRVNNENKLVPVFTIDQLALDRCDYIQLDCEGYEPNVIVGAMETIIQYKPVITLETVDKAIEELLYPLGYRRMEGQFGHIDQCLVVI
jgi:FkbM family methyltransferase